MITERHRRLAAEIADRRPGWSLDAIAVSVSCFIDGGNGYEDSDIVSAVLCGHEPAATGAQMAPIESESGQNPTAGSLVSAERRIGPPRRQMHHGPS
jgi:hypothetical protein